MMTDEQEQEWKEPVAQPLVGVFGNNRTHGHKALSIPQPNRGIKFDSWLAKAWEERRRGQFRPHFCLALFSPLQRAPRCHRLVVINYLTGRIYGF